METIGGRIAALRGLKRWTQHHLASEAGTSQSVLSDIEHDKTSPTWDLLNRLADALALPVMALLPISVTPVFGGAAAEAGRPVQEGAGAMSDDERQVWRELLRLKDQLLAEREATILELRSAKP